MGRRQRWSAYLRSRSHRKRHARTRVEPREAERAEPDVPVPPLPPLDEWFGDEPDESEG